MIYRLVGQAERQIDAVLLTSAREWGLDAARNYLRLMLAVFSALSTHPIRPGARQIEQTDGALVYPLRLGRRLVAAQHRVKSPRHLVVYRVANDGTVEILGLVHDRMRMVRAVRRLQRLA